MKVILLQDVKDQGKKGSLVEVSDGYARNYLFPRKLATAATPDAVNAYNVKEKARLAQQQREREEAVRVAAKLAELTVSVTAKAGANGKLFGSVTSKEVSEALEQQTGISVDSKRIIISEPIKSFGSYTVKCRLGYEVSSNLTVIVKEAE